jgi:hypothetical protein
MKKLPIYVKYKPSETQERAYAIGCVLGCDYRKLEEWIYSGVAGVPDVDDAFKERLVADDRLAVFFKAGRAGREIPVWAWGWRWGDLPESGKSRNWADDRNEPGVSCIHVEGDDWESSSSTFEMFNKKGRTKVYCAGWTVMHARGSDSEPLLAGAIRIAKPKGA